jgi:hypothetical protein
MNNPSKSEFSRIRVDSDKIRSYLEIPSPEEVARLSALMAPHDGRSAGDLVAEAISIRLLANTQVFDRCAEALRAMNRVTVESLAERLGLLGEIVGIPRVVHAGEDPRIAAVRKQLVELDSVEWDEMERDRQQEAERLEDLFMDIGGTIPRRPWRLREILVFFTGEKPAFGEILETAYRDFLLVDCVGDIIERELDYHIDKRNEWILRSNEFSDLPEYLNRNEISTIVAEEEKRIGEIQFIIEQRRSFVPGANLDARHGDFVYFLHLERPSDLSATNVGIILGSGFRDFWKRHESGYREILKAKDSKISDKRQKNLLAGRIGLENRDGRRWKERASRFVDYLELSGLKPDPQSIGGISDNFARQILGLKTAETISDATAFFGTLYTAVTNDIVADESLRLLRCHRVKSGKRVVKREEKSKKAGLQSVNEIRFKTLNLDDFKECLKIVKKGLLI